LCGWKKWHWENLFPQVLASFLPSIIPPMLHARISPIHHRRYTILATVKQPHLELYSITKKSLTHERENTFPTSAAPRQSRPESNNPICYVALCDEYFNWILEKRGGFLGNFSLLIIGFAGFPVF
jgi:hypothetical protein